MNIIEEVKGIPFESALDALGVNLRSWKNKPFSVCCFLPGHDDRHPSMVVYPQTDSVWCFGCNRGGDIFQITAEVLNTDIKGAINWWKSRLGLDDAPRKYSAPTKRIDRSQELEQLKDLAHRLPLRSEYDIPKPHDPDLLDMWEYVYEGKDILDEKYKEPKSYQELGEYVEELRAWRRRAFKLLDFGWSNDDVDPLPDL